MQVFNLFYKIVKTRWVSLLIYTVIFVLILNFADFGGGDTSFTSSKMRLTLYDMDESAASKKLVDYISKNNEIIDYKNDKDVLIDALYYTSTNYVITINKGFEEKLKAGEDNDLFEAQYLHDSNTNKLADDMLNSYVSTVNAYMTGGMELYEAQDKAASALSEKSEVNFETFTDDNSFKATGFFNFVPYILFSLIVSAIAPVIIAMNRKDIFFRTKCSSMKESSINFQTILASTIFVAFIWLLLMGMGIMKNGEMYSGRIWYAVLNTLAFTIISIAIAMLIASFNVSEDALSFISVVLGLGMSFLCGMFVPLELLDSKVIAIGRFLPLYWYIRANNMICGSGNELFNLSKVMKFMGVELLFAVAIFAFAFAVRKQKKAL